MNGPIPTTLLIAAQAFGPRMHAGRVAEAVAEGVARDGGKPEPDCCPLPEDPCRDVGGMLAACDFDARMRASRALVIVTRRLDEGTLPGSVAFEIATRARQSGVPCYAVTAEDAFSAFDARILDLQIVIEARGARSLRSAGARLAEIA
ncbi:MAG: hypothetical protein ACYCUM_02615 [Solirubrobacteraceae bacterium]